MTLHLYFARRFLRLFGALFAGFAVFMWLIELLEHIRRFDAGEVGFGALAFMALLRLPEILYQILTLIVLLSAIALFLTLARTSELVIARATGRSALRSLAAPAVAAMLLGGGIPVVAAVSQEYRTLENRLRGSERIVSLSREGLWLRQGSRERQTAIHAESANMDGTHLYGVTFFAFDRTDQAVYRIAGAEAVLGNGAWVVTDAKRWDFGEGGNPEGSAKRESQLFVATDLTRDQIRDSFGTPSSVPIWDLPNFIARLEAAGFSARSHRVWLNAELAKPLGFLAMVLVGAVFTLRPQRSGHTGLMVLSAVLTGFGVYFVGNLAQVMGDSGQIPVAVSVWAPPMAAILLALGLLLHLEDG